MATHDATHLGVDVRPVAANTPPAAQSSSPGSGWVPDVTPGARNRLGNSSAWHASGARHSDNGGGEPSYLTPEMRYVPHRAARRGSPPPGNKSRAAVLADVASRVRNEDTLLNRPENDSVWASRRWLRFEDQLERHFVAAKRRQLDSSRKNVSRFMAVLITLSTVQVSATTYRDIGAPMLALGLCTLIVPQWVIVVSTNMLVSSAPASLLCRRYDVVVGACWFLTTAYLSNFPTFHCEVLGIPIPKSPTCAVAAEGRVAWQSFSYVIVFTFVVAQTMYLRWTIVVLLSWALTVTFVGLTMLWAAAYGPLLAAALAVLVVPPLAAYKADAAHRARFLLQLLSSERYEALLAERERAHEAWHQQRAAEVAKDSVRRALGYTLHETMNALHGLNAVVERWVDDIHPHGPGVADGSGTVAAGDVSLHRGYDVADDLGDVPGQLRSPKAGPIRAASLRPSGASDPIVLPAPAVRGAASVPHVDAEDVQVVAMSAYAIRRVCQDGLDAQKLAAGHLRVHMRATDVEALVQRTAAAYRLATNVPIHVKVSPLSSVGDDSWASSLPHGHLPTAYVDAHRVAQILRNAISNAVKVCKEGSITVRVGMRVYDTPRPAAGNDDDDDDARQAPTREEIARVHALSDDGTRVAGAAAALDAGRHPSAPKPVLARFGSSGSPRSSALTPSAIHMSSTPYSRAAAAAGESEAARPATAPAFAASDATHEDDGPVRLDVMLCVEDTGPGLGGRDPESFFAEFAQSDDIRLAAQGTGLGLPLARRLVHMMGGDIGLEEDPTAGVTRMWFTLPGEKQGEQQFVLPEPLGAHQRGSIASGWRSDVALEEADGGSAQPQLPAARSDTVAATSTLLSPGGASGSGRTPSGVPTHAGAGAATPGFTATATATSSNGHGTFTPPIPMIVGDELAPGSASARRNLRLSRQLHVALCDDESLNLKIAKRLLTTLGCSVVTFLDGDELPAALRASGQLPGHTKYGGPGRTTTKPESRADSDEANLLAEMKPPRIDVCLIDTVMVRSYGPDVMRALRAAGSTVPMVAATGNHSREDVRKYAAAGAIAVLPKPFSLSMMYELLEHHVVPLRAVDEY